MTRSSRNKKRIYTGLITLAICAIMLPRYADSKIVTNVPSDISGEELRALVVEDFEQGEISEKGWAVETVPREFKKAKEDPKLEKKNPVPILELKFVKGSPNDLRAEEWSLTEKGMKKEQCLGLRFKFRYPGPNAVHIMVPLEVSWKEKKPVYTYNPSTRRDEQERGIQLPGQSKAISLWVHGRGNPYDLEVWVKDYRGDTHILKFGSVNFVGWRPLKVFIPASVPQSYESYPQTRVTKITRFVLRAQDSASGAELIENTYFFFDQLKVLTDTYEVNFDGSDLHRAFGDEKPAGASTAK